MITPRFNGTYVLGEAGGTGSVVAVPLHQIYDDRRMGSAVIVTRTNGTAPGTSKTVTFNFATVNKPGDGVPYTATELAGAVESYVMAITDAGDTRQVFVVPNFHALAPFLNFYLNWDALDAGATITVTVEIYTNPER